MARDHSLSPGHEAWFRSRDRVARPGFGHVTALRRARAQALCALLSARPRAVVAAGAAARVAFIPLFLCLAAGWCRCPLRLTRKRNFLNPSLQRLTS